MSGGIRHEAPLPSEQTLTEIYGVSRGVIRDVLSLLRGEGLIHRLQGSGTFVDCVPLTGRNIDMLDMRLEPSDDARIYRSAVMTELVPAPAIVARRLGLATSDPVVYHERINHLDGQPVTLRSGWMPMSVGSRLVDERVDLQRPVLDVIEGVLGFTVDSAELMVEACCADEATAPILDIEIGAPLVLIERLFRDVGGRPIELSFSRIRADRLFLRTVLRRDNGMAAVAN